MSEIDRLFTDAHHEGELSEASYDLLAIPDVGAQIEAGLGIDVGNIAASEVVLVNLLIDNSGSMNPLASAAIDGQNYCFDALEDSKQAEEILVTARFLDGVILNPYCLLQDAERMNPDNYLTHGLTPLYDEALFFLGLVIAKTQELEENGIPVRSISLILTDGADNDSVHTAADVQNLVDDMRKSERHIVAGMGIEDGTTDFKNVFQGMGIPDEWILTPQDTESDLRKAFALFSRSAVRVSQNAAPGQDLGGFGT